MSITSVIELVTVKPNTEYDTLVYIDIAKGKQFKKRVWNPEFRELVKSASKGQKFTAIFDKVGQYFEIKDLSITASEAPKQSPQEQVVSKVIPQTRENSIETQVAIKCLIELIANDKADMNEPMMASLVQDTLEWLRSRIPHSNATMPKKAPEPVEAREIPMITGAQLFQLRKKVKATDDNDLLAQAEVFVGRALGCLNDITFDEADVWINKVAKK